jgi:hypothetical protein
MHVMPEVIVRGSTPCAGAPVEVEEYVDPDDVPDEEKDKIEDKGTKALANRQVTTWVVIDSALLLYPHQHAYFCMMIL